MDHLGCDLSDGRAPRPPHGGLFQRRRLTCVSAETALPCLDRYAKSCVRRDLHHWSQGGSNPRPSACHADALPTAPWPLGFFVFHCLRIGRTWQGGFLTLPSRTQIRHGRAITASRPDDEPGILPRECGFGPKKPPPASAKAWRAKGGGQVHPVPALAERDAFESEAPGAIIMTLMTPWRAVHARERSTEKQGAFAGNG